MNTGEKISDIHMMFAIACIIQGSLLLSSFIAGITKQDSWFIVITGYLFSLLIACIYIALAGKFPGMTLVQINELVFGKVMGKIVSGLYLFFFLSLCALNGMDLGNFVGGDLLPNTPKVIIISTFMFCCAWAVKKGIVNMLRYSILFSFLTFTMIIVSSLLQINDFKLRAFLPVLTLPPLNYIQATHIIMAIPYLEVVGFLMIFPQMRSQGSVKKVIFGGLGIGALTLLMVVVRDIAILGNLVVQFTIPTYESLHLINVADVLTRMEVYLSTLFIILVFFKVSILYYITIAILAQICGLERQGSLVSALGALIVIYAMIVFPSGSENAVWAKTTAPFFSTSFQIALPFLTLVVAAVRFPQKERDPQPEQRPNPSAEPGAKS